MTNPLERLQHHVTGAIERGEKTAIVAVEAPEFKTPFKSFACEGDSITCEFEGFTATARIYRDDCTDRPDQRDDGFWPSLDSSSAGYIGPKSQRTLERHKAKARDIMRAWEADEWFYCGVAVTIERNDVELTHKYGAALWGIECNYPGGDNLYLLQVANELLPEAIAAAKAKLTELATA